MPNNKCDANIDHHDHENEKEHLHKHSNRKTAPKYRPFDLSLSEPNLKTNRQNSKNQSRNLFGLLEGYYGFKRLILGAELNMAEAKSKLLEEDSSTGGKRTTVTSTTTTTSETTGVVPSGPADVKNPATTDTTVTTHCLCSSSFSPSSDEIDSSNMMKSQLMGVGGLPKPKQISTTSADENAVVMMLSDGATSSGGDLNNNSRLVENQKSRDLEKFMDYKRLSSHGHSHSFNRFGEFDNYFQGNIY